MRMRFCATMRRPAFSITALTAPVRLRAVASGLMIEKVRSMAMILSLKRKKVVQSCRAYIGAFAIRQAMPDRRGAHFALAAEAGFQRGLQRFHPDEPNLKALSGFGSAS